MFAFMRSQNPSCWGNRGLCARSSQGNPSCMTSKAAECWSRDFRAEQNWSLTTVHGFSVLAVVRNLQRTLIIVCWKLAKSVHALRRDQAGSIQRGAPARGVNLRCAVAAIPVNRKGEKYARSLGRSRIHLSLVPGLRHFPVDLVYIPRKQAGKIVVADRRWAGRSDLHLVWHH